MSWLEVDGSGSLIDSDVDLGEVGADDEESSDCDLEIPDVEGSGVLVETGLPL